MALRQQSINQKFRKIPEVFVVWAASCISCKRLDGMLLEMNGKLTMGNWNYHALHKAWSKVYLKLEVWFKSLCTESKNRCCFPPLIWILVLQVSFWSFGWVWLSFGGFVIIVAFSFKSQGTEKNGLFFQGNENSQNLRHAILIIVDPKYIQFPVFLCWI